MPQREIIKARADQRTAPSRYQVRNRLRHEHTASLKPPELALNVHRSISGDPGLQSGTFDLPIPFSGSIVLSAGLMIRIAAGFPMLDTKAICSGIAGLGLGDVPAACQHGEEQARDQLKAIWPTVTAVERSLCVNDAHLSLAPSYADLFVCIKTHRDLEMLKHSAQGAAPNTDKATVPIFTLTGEDVTELRQLCQEPKIALALCARLPPPE